MSIEERSGADGTYIVLGRQSARGTKLTMNSEMIAKRLLVSAIDIDEEADIEESNIISALGSDVPSEQGQYSIGGSLTTRVFVEDFWHLLRGIMVVRDADIVSTALTGVEAEAQTSGLFTSLSADAFDEKFAKAQVSGGDTFEWASKLQLVLTGSPTVAEGAKMTIRGYRRGGRPNQDRFYQTEEVALTATGATSTKFWQEIIDVSAEGLSGGTSPTFALNWVPDTMRTTFTFQSSNPDFQGWTGLIVKGGYPAVAEDLIPSSMNLRFGQGASDVQMQFVGSRIDHERTIAGGEGRQVALSAEDQAAFPLPANGRAYPSWAGAFSFGDEIVKYTDIDVGINLNLQANPGFDGSRFRRGFSPTNNRQVTFNPTTLFRTGDEAADVFTNWQQQFRNDERQKLSFVMYAFDPSGRNYRVNITTPSAQIIESPRIEVQGPGPISRRIPFKALPEAGSSTTEMNIEILTQNGYSEG